MGRQSVRQPAGVVHRAKHFSCMLPLPCAEAVCSRKQCCARACDVMPTARAVPAAQVRGPHTVSKYFNSDAAAADAEGWFDTGDVATIDALGHMQVG